MRRLPQPLGALLLPHAVRQRGLLSCDEDNLLRTDRRHAALRVRDRQKSVLRPQRAEALGETSLITRAREIPPFPVIDRDHARHRERCLGMFLDGSKLRLTSAAALSKNRRSGLESRKRYLRHG
jgi:hypothetical protein